MKTKHKDIKHVIVLRYRDATEKQLWSRRKRVVLFLYLHLY